MISRILRTFGLRGRWGPRAGWAVALAVVLPCLAAARSVAQSAPIAVAAKSSSDAAIGRLPADLELVVCVRDADRQRQSPPGRAIVQSIAGAKLFSETSAAWVKFGVLLGWGPEEAFSRLAGRRLVLAIGPVVDGARSWALLSDVYGDAERRLRSRLRPSPRQTIAGQPVLSLEDGRFELAIFCPPINSAARAATPCTIILAPTGRGDLLDRIVRGLAGEPPGSTLADSAAMKDVRSLMGADIFVLAQRLDDGGAEFAATGATLDGDGWTARLRASHGWFAGSVMRDEPTLPWSAAAADELAPGAIALLLSDGLPGLERWVPLLAIPTLPEAAERLRGLLGRRTFLGLFRSPNPDCEPATVALAVGFESPDIGALAAPGDAVVGRLVAAIEAGADARERDRPDFLGFLPSSPRVVPLTGQASVIWRPLLGLRPALAWVYRPTPSGSGGGPLPGWWFATLAPSDEGGRLSGWVSRACETLARPRAANDLRPRVSVGSVRVADLVRWIAEVHADPTESLLPLRCIENIRWDAWVVPGGRVDGEARISVPPVP